MGVFSQIYSKMKKIKKRITMDLPWKKIYLVLCALFCDCVIVIFDVKNVDFSELQCYLCKHFFFNLAEGKFWQCDDSPNFSFFWRVIYSSMKSQSWRTTVLENWSKICTIPMALKLLPQFTERNTLLLQKVHVTYTHTWVCMYRYLQQK